MIAVAILSTDELSRLLPDPEAGFGALTTTAGNVPMEAVDVRARITGLSALIELRQTFRNSQSIPLEATYIFPLPDRAAVTAFRFEVAGRCIDGMLQERGAARAEYDRAIATGHRAAIAEEERPGAFTMRVGNLLPRESATVQLTLSMPLPYSDGEASFRFPLVVAPRYIPGKLLEGESAGDGTARDTDAVPDASRISPPVLLPGFSNPVRLAIEVDIDPAGLPLSAVRSSLHTVTEERGSAGLRVRVQPGERLDRDFVLRLAIADDSVRSSLASRADEEGGTFALTLVPPVNVSRQTRPRDVIFVLDRSGSMEGWKMVGARRAVARMVDTLNDRDRFTVLAFDDHIDRPSQFPARTLMSATDRHRFQAVEFLAHVDARGGTEMAEPLTRAATELRSSESSRDRILVLVTDGQVGNEDQILRALTPLLTGLRIFTLGVDSAVNEGFLRRLAAAGGGAMELVESENALDQVMERFQRRIGTPVLTQLAVEAQGCQLEADSLTPARLPDLLAGAPVVIRGRYRGAPGAIAIRGTDAAGEPWSVALQPIASDNRALSAQWARARLRDLEDEYVVRPQDRLAAQIVQTSIRFGVLCRFTAFVAVDRAEVVNPGGATAKQTQAVDAPAGWDMLSKAKGGIGALRSMFGGPGGGGAPAMAQAAAPPPPPHAPARMMSVSAAAPMPPPMMTGSVSRHRVGGGPVGGPAVGSASGSGFTADGAESTAAIAALDLAPYRARATALLELFLAKDPARSRRAALGALIVQLTMLVEDLRSVGAPGADFAPLQALLQSLEAIKANAATGEPGPFETDAEKALRAFATGTPPSVEEPGRRAFWK